jgi:type VI secretion system protein ImpA
VQVRSFYAKHEPASPIPLLIHRIERMVPMTFLESLQEMAPDSIKEVTNIVGPQE